MARDRARPNPVAHWATMILAAAILALGVVIGAGGVWLLTLGGSWYYAIAGLGLIATGVLMLMGRMLGVFAYVATFLFTLVWAFWEAGLDGWALVPRLAGPAVLLVLVLLTIPVLRRRDTSRETWSRQGAATAATAAFAFLLVSGPWSSDLGQLTAVAQDTSVEVAPDAVVEPQPDPVPAEPAAPATTGEPAPAPGVEPATPDAIAPAALTETPAAGEADPAETVDPATPAETAPPASEPVNAQRQARPMAEIGEDWPAYGGDLHATRYSPLAQITPDNVAELERLWEFSTGDLPSEAAEGKYSPENTPLKVGDSLFICTPMGKITAVEALTGKEQWHFDPEVPVDAIPYGATCRGVAYYEVADAEPDSLCATRIIWGTLDARLIAIDSGTGQLCSDFGNNGEVDLEEGLGRTVPGWYALTSPPTIVRGVAVVGAQVTDGNAEDSPSGVVRGYDAVTGELVWAWDLENPDLTVPLAEGETYSRGTPNMWTIASGDEELGQVYLPLGNSAVDYYGSNRSAAENEFATALVALDATTGEEAWHFQTVRNDVWDYDLGSQPSLVDFPTDDGSVPAIVLASKQGDIYILDRRSGEPLFPVEDRPVPQGGVEPDYLAETQPFSTYHTLAFPPLEERDMWGFTPIDQLWCRIQFRQSNYEGIYTPPSADRPWIQYPGYNGGNDWGSLAIDVERGLIIANYNNMPNHNQLIPRERVDELGVVPIDAPEQNPNAPSDIAPQAGAPYGIDVNAGWRVGFTGLLCKEPPYGGIRAIDLSTGDTVWDRPFGTARNNGPFGIPSMLPLTIGTPNNGGPVVTAGGLIFIGATTDNLIHAIDVETGETVWTDVLPGGGQATPMVYEIDGRQVVLIYPGGHHFMETPISDQVIAYALPEN